MHHIHRTKSFVLKNQSKGESDCQITLLTKDLGVVRTIAQGVRKMESKLRQSIQDYSLVEISMVSGRTGWRVVNAVFEKNLYTGIKDSTYRDIFVRVFGLIDRMVPGESADSDIFEIVNDFTNIAILDDLSNYDALSFEAIFIARILRSLGYMNHDFDKGYLNSNLSLNPPERDGLVKEINRAIKDSSL